MPKERLFFPHDSIFNDFVSPTNLLKEYDKYYQIIIFLNSLLAFLSCTFGNKQLRTVHINITEIDFILDQTLPMLI